MGDRRCAGGRVAASEGDGAGAAQVGDHGAVFGGDHVAEGDDAVVVGLAVLIGHNAIIPGLEAALLGREAGESFDVTVSPDQAYGERRRQRVEESNKSKAQPPRLKKYPDLPS